MWRWKIRVILKPQLKNLVAEHAPLPKRLQRLLFERTFCIAKGDEHNVFG
jgi:hypothetical protein|tara:strand:+ start:4024 stop:4173 length:150 start_codon:yes stop_codon:yes gene_type:complete